MNKTKHTKIKILKEKVVSLPYITILAAIDCVFYSSVSHSITVYLIDDKSRQITLYIPIGGWPSVKKTLNDLMEAHSTGSYIQIFGKLLASPEGNCSIFEKFALNIVEGSAKSGHSDSGNADESQEHNYDTVLSRFYRPYIVVETSPIQ